MSTLPSIADLFQSFNGYPNKRICLLYLLMKQMVPGFTTAICSEIAIKVIKYISYLLGCPIKLGAPEVRWGAVKIFVQ